MPCRKLISRRHWKLYRLSPCARVALRSFVLELTEPYCIGIKATKAIILYSCRPFLRRVSTSVTTSLGIELQRKNKKRYVSHNTQARQHDNDIPACSKSFPAQTVVANFTEELPIALHTPESTHAQYPRAIHGE